MRSKIMTMIRRLILPCQLFCFRTPTSLIPKRFYTDTDTNTDDGLSSTFVIHPDLRNIPKRLRVPPELAIGEAFGLVKAVSSWKLVGEHIEILKRPHVKYLFGETKVAELTSLVKKKQVDNVFINIPSLTPRQQHELERKFNAAVYDRFMVILKIFQERARTNEAKLQVELAEIPYLKSRLSDENWIYTSATTRMRGAGETPLNIKRRVLAEREAKLKQQLQQIKDDRKVTRVKRKKKALPVVAVVGYTNAGKTTLIKQLTKEESMEPKDQLFATLDSTVHAGKLPCKMKVLFLDTIGFISDLPHELVESFSATLEDVLLADVLIHVRDVSHPLTDMQKHDVIKVLTGLNPPPSLLENMIEVHNKIDLLTTSDDSDDESSSTSESDSSSSEDEDSEFSLPVSATQGDGVDILWDRIQEEVLQATGDKHIVFTVPTDGPQLSWLHQNATVTTVKSTNENTLQISAVISMANFAKYNAKFHSNAEQQI